MDFVCEYCSLRIFIVEKILIFESFKSYEYFENCCLCNSAKRKKSCIILVGDMEDSRENIYVGILWVFSNISGLLTLMPDGTINSINENFALMLFGYSRADLIGKVLRFYHSMH